MPIIIEWTYKDGTKEINRIPAQIWRHDEQQVKKLFLKSKEVASIRLDPLRETADIDESNNGWNTMPAATKFKAYSQKQGVVRGQSVGTNPMQQSKL